MESELTFHKFIDTDLVIISYHKGRINIKVKQYQIFLANNQPANNNLQIVGRFIQLNEVRDRHLLKNRVHLLVKRTCSREFRQQFLPNQQKNLFKSSLQFFYSIKNNGNFMIQKKRESINFLYKYQVQLKGKPVFKFFQINLRQFPDKEIQNIKFQMIDQENKIIYEKNTSQQILAQNQTEKPLESFKRYSQSMMKDQSEQNLDKIKSPSKAEGEENNKYKLTMSDDPYNFEHQNKINQIMQKVQRSNRHISTLPIHSKIDTLFLYEQKPQSIQIKRKYYFSEKYKNQNIQIFNSNQSIRTLARDSSYKIALISPFQLNQVDSFPPNQQYFYRIQFKINNLKSYMAVGIRDISESEACQFTEYPTGPTLLEKNTYINDWKGFLWSQYRIGRKLVNQTKGGICFASDHIVRLDFYPRSKVLKFKNQNSIYLIPLKIDPETNLKNMCFCVYLLGDGDQLSIINEPQIIKEKQKRQIQVSEKQDDKMQMQE